MTTYGSESASSTGDSSTPTVPPPHHQEERTGSRVLHTKRMGARHRTVRPSPSASSDTRISAASPSNIPRKVGSRSG